MSPDVSILTCTYNRPEMLRESVESLRAQTRGGWEHLICDDASTNVKVLSLLRKLDRDPRVRVYQGRKNINQPAVYWNEMVDRARGKYIGFLDDDNLKCPKFIETLAGVLDSSPDVDMVTCGFVMRSEEGDTLHQWNLRTDSEIAIRSTIDTGCFLIRREAFERIGYFPLDIRTNEDWALMRRAAATLRIQHLSDCLGIYRVHPGQRMKYCEDLGNSKDKITILSTRWEEYLGVSVYVAPVDRLTRSQIDVANDVTDGIAAIPWVAVGGQDVTVMLAPFRMDVGFAKKVASRARTVVSVHSEDPYAVEANLDRVKAMVEVCSEVWVVTNDTATVDSYREVVGDHVIVCSSLSADHRRIPNPKPFSERKTDVVLVGYAYPARVKFVQELGKHFDLSRIRIRGDGWKEAGFATAKDTAKFEETVEEYANAKAVLCLHRIHGDCGGGPFPPRFVQRGYVEGVAGARVFLDTQRSDHAFEENEVAWFSGPEDLASKLEAFFEMSPAAQEDLGRPLCDRAARDFTYKTRMTRVLNAVRSRRYMAVIP